MKRFAAGLLALMMVLIVVPVHAAEPMATSARTTLLDLRSVTSNQSNSSQGWSFQPTGENGNPVLTLNGYGLANAHSAPIQLPKNTHVIVNGDCYIDNSYMGEEYNCITSAYDGYLTIDGSGTLNLYATQYYGCCIEITSGGENEGTLEPLTISDITVNCYGIVSDNYTSAKNKPCLCCYEDIIIRNAVLNTYDGGYGIKNFGYTPIGGVTEATANEILIDNSTVNIEMNPLNNCWSHAVGISTTFGKVRITGDSNVTINAGTKCIYSYLGLFIEGGRVHVGATTVSNSYVHAGVYCRRLVIGSEAKDVYFGVKRYATAMPLYCTEEGTSVLEAGPEVVIGSFANGTYTTAPDPDNNNLPALHVTSETGPAFLVGDVNCDGFVDFSDVSLLYSYVLNISALSEEGMLAADINGDGLINSTDVTALCQLILNA